MRKPAAYLFAMLVGAVIWFFFQHFKIEGLESVKVMPKAPEELDGASDSQEAAEREPSVLDSLHGLLPESSSSPSVESKHVDRQPAKSEFIRVATLHLEYFGQLNAQKPHAMGMVARVVRRFDVVAFQGVSPKGTTAVAELTELVNQTGREYDYLLGAPAAVQQHDQQYAFVYDRETIVADRNELYTLGDPSDLLRREPLVGWFRARQAAANEAFTFTLVNVHTEQRRNLQELNVLDDVFHEVRDDGRGEDDVIMLGCFHADEQNLGQLGRVAGLVAAIRGVPTTVDGGLQTENILFRTPVTDEYNGRSGVFDFAHVYELGENEAREVSAYLPVWAEFSIYEGGRPGRVAAEDLPRR